MSAAAQTVPESCDLTLRIAGMSCAACQSHVQRALAAVPGVRDASVDLLANTAHVTAAPAASLEILTSAVRHAGYDVVLPQAMEQGSRTDTANRSSSTQEGIEPSQQSLGLRAVLTIAAGAVAMVLSMPLMSSATPSGQDALTRTMMRVTVPVLPVWLLQASPSLLRWILFSLALCAMLFAAPEIYRAAWRAARHRATNMNTLVALGTLIAFCASTYTTVLFSIGRASRNFNDVYFEAVVLILGFLLAGRWLEARARDRATASLRSFAHTEAGSARWIAEGAPAELQSNPEALLSAPDTLLPLDAVAVGDILRVLPGDRIPLDGIILAGRSSVDESMLTGEPLPVGRSAGNKLFAGTLNLDGPLLLRATALGADSMQAQMQRLLERARSTRAPLQRLADRVSAVFVPTVLGLAGITFTAWAMADNFGAHHLGYGRALSFAIAVLVVACPCAMGLAVPAAVAVSLGAAARAGMLIKGGEALEQLATIDLVALDKTGTLTEGKPTIAAFEQVAASASLQPYSRETLLSWASAVEGASTHPLADAVRTFSGVPGGHTEVRGARVLPGIGAEAYIDAHLVIIGNAAILPQDAPTPPRPNHLQHATPLYLVIDGQHQANFYATDIARPSARATIASLHKLGVTTTLLTGDTREAAESVADQVGIQVPDSVRAALMPADKLTAIEALQASGHRVAMVGDGLNDAAALARANAGIAMASGTDLAREAGHVLLLHHDLRLVPQAIQIARRTRRLMRQNLGWALLYNVLGIPLAAGLLYPRFGLALSPAFASAAMALSSVSVLVNSLRLATVPSLGPLPTPAAPARTR